MTVSHRPRPAQPSDPACPELHEPPPPSRLARCEDCPRCGIQVYAVATGSSNGGRLPVARDGELKSNGEVALLTVPSGCRIRQAQGHLRSLVALDNERPFDQAAINGVRALAGYAPEPELPAGVVTETDDGLPLELNQKSNTGYKYVMAKRGRFIVTPTTSSHKADVRKYFQSGARQYATALDAASDLARQVRLVDERPGHKYRRVGPRHGTRC